MKSTAKNLGQGFSDPFFAGLNQVIDQKLRQEIIHVDQILAARLDQAGSLLAEAEKGLERVIDRAADAAQRGTQAVIREAGAEADKLIQQLEASIIRIVDELACKVASERSSISDTIKYALTFVPQIWNRCHRDAGLAWWATPTADRPAQSFAIRECEILNELTPELSPAQIQARYVDLLGLAGARRCSFQKGSPGDEFYALKIIEYRRRFSAWSDHAK